MPQALSIKQHRLLELCLRILLLCLPRQLRYIANIVNTDPEHNFCPGFGQLASFTSIYCKIVIVKWQIIQFPEKYLKCIWNVLYISNTLGKYLFTKCTNTFHFRKHKYKYKYLKKVFKYFQIEILLYLTRCLVWIMCQSTHVWVDWQMSGKCKYCCFMSTLMYTGKLN